MNRPSVPCFELSELSLSNRLGQGGQGQVTAVNNVVLNKRWPAALKQYSPEQALRLRVTVLEAAVAFPATLGHQDGRWLYESSAWPAAMVTNRGTVCGFLMRMAPSAYYFDFQTQTRGVQKKLATMEFLLNSERYIKSSGI